ncbi:MAG: ATP-binding cassette domain-containing protein, partial [SAR202 cluster bacterium]|nr:ATP-binding cassette domain-containing protein [SAR202 cluster bacterium]
KATRGRASIMGIDVAQDPQSVRQIIGLAGQYAAVDENLTGRENLRLIGRLTHLPRDLAYKRADEMLERFDLNPAADRPARTYSGGMRRRLDLAAALVHRPPVVFLDEPTTGLDPSSRSDLWAIIGELVNDGTTVLITTHYLDEADRLSDRIIVIDDGAIIAQGTSGELKSNLGAAVVEVTMHDTDGARKASAALAAVGTGAIAGDGRTIEIRANDGPRGMMDVVRILDREGLVPADLGIRESTLDDVFLSLTGGKAKSKAPAPKPASRRGRP